MVLVNELKGRIRSKGLTQADVAKKLGVSTKTFNSRLKCGVLGSDEIEKLIEVLGIDNPCEIFFAKKVS